MSIDFAAALDVIDASNRVGALNDLGTSVAHALGFRWFHYHCDLRSEDVTNGPTGWHDRYQSANYGIRDPLRRRTRRLRQIVAWQEGSDANDNETASFLAESASLGAGSGVNIPVFGGFGREAFLCFSNDRKLLLEDTDDYNCPLLYMIAARLDQLFLAEELRGSAARDLTTQERLCLGWVSRGKTMSETATIIGIQRRTVEFHLTNARTKLDATTVSQAVAEAIRRDLIA